jgi:hypothetical protein
MSVKKYKIYCTDELVNVYGWSELIPTTCFNNNTHTIDTKLTEVVVDSPISVSIVQTNLGNSLYFDKTFGGIIGPHETTDITTVFKVPMNMFSVNIITRQENMGDEMSAFINKDTKAGAVTSSGSGSSIPTSLSTCRLGVYVKFGSSERYQVIGFSAGVITIDGTVDYTAGNFVYITYYMVVNKVINSPGINMLGTSIIGSTLVQAGTVVGITYKNNSNLQKKIHIDIETTF